MPRSYGIVNAAPYASPPAVGLSGDEYYNTAGKVLYLSDGTVWNPVSAAIAPVASTAPTATAPTIAPPTGLLWIDTSTAPVGASAYYPPQTPPASGFNSYTDSSGTVWVSRNGSAWKMARDVLHARVWRNAAINFSTTSGVFAFDTVARDPYAMWNSGTFAFVVPIPGIWLISNSVTGNVAVNAQWVNNFINLNGITQVFTGFTSYVGYVPCPQTTSLLCAAGDSIITATNSSNGSPAVVGQQWYNYMNIDYLGTG